MSLNEVISTISTLVGIVVPVVGALLYILTRRPEKKVIFFVSICTVVVIACVLGIAVVISDATNGITSSAAQPTSPALPADTATTVTQPVIPTSPPTTVGINKSDAASIMAGFCEDINSGYREGAYALTTSSYQAQHGINDFNNQFNYPDLSKGGCLYDTPQVSGDTATVKLTFDQLNINNGITSTTTYTVTLIKDPQNNNELRINSIQ